MCCNPKKFGLTSSDGIYSYWLRWKDRKFERGTIPAIGAFGFVQVQLDYFRCKLFVQVQIAYIRCEWVDAVGQSFVRVSIG